MLGPQRAPCETTVPARPHEAAAATRWILPATILGSSLGFIDGSVVNVALPVMERDLGARFATIQWVVNGYLLTLAGFILLGGALSDRYGRRRIFAIGLLGFGVTSIACGLAPSAAWLIAARLVQGAAAALLVPASLAIIGAGYRGEARGRAIGTWAAAGALTTALGPPLGGALIDALGWRAVFFINPPIVALSLLFASRIRLPQRARRPAPLDTAGAAIAVCALGLLSYGSIAAGEGRSMAGVLATGAALPLLWGFVVQERRFPAPMVPPALFRNRNFIGANLLTVLLYAALTAALFLLPFLLIRTHGYSAAAAGAAFLPFSIIMGLGSRWTGGLVERIGPGVPLVAGPLLTAAGFGSLAMTAHLADYATGILPGLVVIGVGMTLTVAPLTTTVFDSVPGEQSGVASGVNNAAARVGGLAATASLGFAFGGSGLESLTDALITAYRNVMAAAAVLAMLSALIALASIRPLWKRPATTRP